MSVYLNLKYMCADSIGLPSSLENIMDRIQENGYQISAIEVGSLAFEQFAFWRYYDDITRQELHIAYEKQQLSFHIIEKTEIPIALTVELEWGKDQGKHCLGSLNAFTNQTAMFTMKQYDPEHNSQRLLELAKHIYLAITPDFAWIECCGINGYTTNEDVQQLRIPHIYWANFFSPAYVERYGVDFFSQASGWKKESLEDGSFLYVLSPSLMGTGPKALVESVKSYFSVKSARRKKKKRKC